MDCIREAIQGLRSFTHEELEDYVRDVFNRARSFGEASNMRNMDRAIKEINDEKMKSLFEDTTIKANNVAKFDKQANDIKLGKHDFRSLLIPRGKKLSENIRVEQQAEYEHFLQFMLDDMTHDEVTHFSSGKFSQVICDIHDGKKIDDPVSQKIADKLKDYWTFRNARLVLSNAMKLEEMNEDRWFRSVHDQVKVINGNRSLVKIAMEKITRKYDPNHNRNYWKNTIKKFLNMEKTFEKTEAMGIDGTLDMKAVDKILDRIYDNITTGKSQIFTKSVVANDREAIEKKSRMFFHWKGLREQYEYNKVFGKGDLFEMFVGDAQSSGNKIGMAKRFGDSPDNFYSDLRKIQQEKDVEAESPKGARWWRQNDNIFNNLKGTDRASVSPNLANFMANLRSIATMARLPLIATDSISDIAYISSFAQRMGINYSRAYLNHLTHLFNAFPTEERKRIASLFKTNVDSHLGYLGRWGDINNTDLLNKITTGYFKLNRLHAFDEGNKISMMHMMAKHLQENSNKSYKNLDPRLQQWVGKFLDENEWDLLRKKNQQGLFTTDNVDKLTDQELREHYQDTAKDMPLGSLRDDLFRKVHAMFSVAAENAVLSPGAFEKAMLIGQSEAGTIKGELWRTFLHFKMYTVAYIDRVLIKGFQEADTATQKLTWATSMLAGTLPLSVMSTYFHNLVMGLSMPDYDQMSVPERAKYLVGLLAPSLAIFSGILDTHNQNSSMLWSLIGSPTTSLLGNTLAAPLALSEGNPKLAAKRLGNAANYIFPIQTTPLVSPWIREALGQEARLDPGQTHYFGR